MRLLLPILVLVACVSAAFLDAYSGSSVLRLDPDNFQASVVDADATVFVQFYAPFSPNCKKFAATWVELSSMLEREGETGIRLAILDADEHREFSRKFSVDGYPTIIAFGKYLKDTPQVLTEEQTIENLYSEAKRYLAMTEEEAAAMKASLSSSSPDIAAPPSPASSAAGDKKKSKKKFAVGLKKQPARKVIEEEEEEEDLPEAVPEARPMEFDAPKEEEAPAASSSNKGSSEKKRKKKKKKKIVVDDDDSGSGSSPTPSQPAPPQHHNHEHHAKNDYGHAERMKDHDRRLAEMHERHDRMIREITERHDNHIKEVLRRHEQIQEETQRRIEEHHAHMGVHRHAHHIMTPKEDGGVNVEVIPAAEETATSPSMEEEPGL